MRRRCSASSSWALPDGARASPSVGVVETPAWPPWAGTVKVSAHPNRVGRAPSSSRRRFRAAARLAVLEGEDKRIDGRKELKSRRHPWARTGFRPAGACEFIGKTGTISRIDGDGRPGDMSVTR